MKKIVLITGADCPLCEEAKEILNSLQLKDVTLIEKDVYKTREIHNKYWDKINKLFNIEDKSSLRKLSDVNNNL